MWKFSSCGTWKQVHASIHLEIMASLSAHVLGFPIQSVLSVAVLTLKKASDCDGNEIKAWRGTRMPKVLDLAVTPDGEHLISVFSDKDIRIFNLVTNAERVISEEHPITSLSVSINSKFFIVNLNSQEIHLWDVAGKWEKALRYKGHKQHKYVIRSCFGGLNSSFIASGSENSQVCFLSQFTVH